MLVQKQRGINYLTLLKIAHLDLNFVQRCIQL